MADQKTSEELAKSRWAPQGSDEPSSNRHQKRSYKTKSTPQTVRPPQPAVTATTTTTTNGTTITASASSTPNGTSSVPPNTNPKIWTPSPRPAPSNGTAPTSTSPTQHHQEQQQQQQQRAARLPRVVGGVSSSLGDGWENIPTHPEPPIPEPSSSAHSLRSDSQLPTEKKTRPIPPSIADAVEALSRYRKIRRRLEWKLRHLVDGFKQATNRDQPAAEQLYAEQMFKLDFHEYYGLLERALVYLMLVWNIHVSRAHPSTNTNKISWADEMNGGGSSTHRYHANVLEALRDLDSPYFEVLGSGERFAHLQKAKELRNRWKYADVDPEERERDPQTWRAGYKAWKDALTPLESYDFDTIFVQILQGLVEAADIAQQRVDELGREAGQDDAAAAAGGSESDPDDWDFLVDAMDWEAV
ncbi:uncharacterized protein BO72DRAFT_523843 [Aspergillus fijiensis CBS 313.89]|uniref:Uncharacterized protein n=1 Tax=Aspergillus fijiensis CBS 313.89 TaxID=1448319 RepID=A0A8G1W660_9EURO|nr:uncharacterized protein BO72DRAFT_523843 [Aspergillus fijiensis CBS 313.89]RAK81949.1 hypothetical protein BO72DRAFT_523843 [Aspergillus fijiensis CBS 313.89]